MTDCPELSAHGHLAHDRRGHWWRLAAQEAQWLLEHGYTFQPDSNSQVVRCVRRQP